MTEATQTPGSPTTPAPSPEPGSGSGPGTGPGTAPGSATGSATVSRPLQPLLHDLASCVAAPAVLLSAADGQVCRGGVQGLYVADVRQLDRWELSVAGSGLDLVRSDVRATARHAFSYVARSLGDPLPDPTVRLDRTRELLADGVVERVVVESVAAEPVELELRVDLSADLAPMAVVKQGHAGQPVAARAVDGGLGWGEDPGGMSVTAEPAPDDVDTDTGRLAWRLRLDRGERAVVELRAASGAVPLFGAGRPAGWPARVEAADVRVARTAAQGLADLEGLLLSDGGDRFLAAGSPWFLTLFGRDSLWAARMLTPVDPDLALSTLRVLARRQGTRDDLATEEQPGKILHEVRPAVLDLGVQKLPPLYYGTVDATPLFVCALADAADWGADPDGVRALLPAARACLGWVLAQAEESGWLTYVDHTGTGLSNQGWKDSHDSVQFADGTLAEPPISLSEVQAYAHEAAVRGAALLAAHGEEPVDGLEEWATDLRRRFGEEFWVATPEGGHAAIALDRDGRAVDSVTSNLGHLLGTGLLDAAHTARVAALLADERLDSGFGLRTLAADSPRFSRLSYHGGTVWPHDTAIAVRGLAAEGYHDEAARLTRGLVLAAEGVDYRLPELYGGDAAGGPDGVELPSAYPAACRPQAWSAAAPLACLVALAGLRPDAATLSLGHVARTSPVLGAWALRGLRLGEHSFDVEVAADGAVGVVLPEGSPLRVRAI